MARRPRKTPGVISQILRWTAGLLVLLLLLVSGTGAGLVWWSLPAAHQRVQIADMAGPVSVGFDADGIPLISAGSELDAATALGFIHARDRMFQMELTRRATTGRLSEIAGASTLPLDRSMRMLSLARRAAEDLPRLTPETRAVLDAYARGVNAWITARGRFSAPELIPFGAPAPWTTTDSLLWGKSMSLYLAGSWRAKLARAAAEQDFWPPQDHPISPDARLPTRWAALVPQFPAPFTQPSSASNEWAVDARHSATGGPLLAGDPHLGFTMPDLWYLVRIETPQGIRAGATAPGVPFLVLGHNNEVAWTFTTTGADTQDVFIETVLPDGRYLTPDGPQEFTTHEELIHVRGGQDERLRVRETRHGPVLSDLDPASGPVLAVAMAALAPNDTGMDGLRALGLARTVQDIGAAAALITSPVQNLLGADRITIGQFTTGRIPLRGDGDGTRPVPGADGAHDWTGFAAGDALPHVVAPESGRIVNANERVAPPDFPVFMGHDWFGDWRAQRIRTLLAATGKHDLDSFATMQLDPISAFAQAILPRLRRVTPAPGASTAALALLASWDGGMRMEQPQPLIFNAWMRVFTASYMKQQSIPAAAAGAWYDLVAQALNPARDEDAGPLLSQTLAVALAEIAARQGPDPVSWRWGEEHLAVFQHSLLGRLPLIGSAFTWSIPQPGDDTTLNRGGSRSPGWVSGHGAGFRGVYDLAALDQSRFAMTPGQSGHPFRRLASNLMQRWRDGTTLTLGPRTGTAREIVELTP